MRYAVVIEKAGAGYSGYVPDLPGCVAAGATVAKVKAALLGLNPANADQAEILRLNRATRYIATQPENYKGLETAARSAGLL